MYQGSFLGWLFEDPETSLSRTPTVRKYCVRASFSPRDSVTCLESATGAIPQGVSTGPFGGRKERRSPSNQRGPVSEPLLDTLWSQNVRRFSEDQRPSSSTCGEHQECREGSNRG